MEVFLELTLIIVLATVVGIVMKLLKQPLIVGYIFSGILAGPYFFNILHAKEEMELFSKLGIAVLLFIVGLNLNPRVIREVGKVSLLTGIGQVVLTSVVGFVIALLLGIDRIAAMYVAIALTLSSTIIVLKLLSDKGDLEHLYGKIAIGFLIIQDIIATFILLLISSFSQSADSGFALTIGLLLLKGMQVTIVLYLVCEYVLPKLSRFIASSSELLFLFSITWGLGIASLFAVIGFSVEIGALIAGVTLSLTPFAYEISSRLKPLRDFFIVLFFILLGSQMVLDNIVSLLIPAIALSLFVLIGNPIIMILLLNMQGYKRKTSFMAGLAIAQISEFSLILAALGFSIGHLSQEVLSLITLVGLITIAGSTYLMQYTESLFVRLEKVLKLLEIRKHNNREMLASGEKFDFLLFGYDRVGYDFVKTFKKLDRPFLVIDFNPASIARLEEESIPFRFGDAQDAEFLNELHLEQSKLIVSTIPDIKINLLVVKKIRKRNHHAIVLVIAHTANQAQELYDAGATYVILPHYLGARYASGMITRLGLDQSAFKEEREKHIRHLEKRK
ncbi:MAG: cation:proton antiporter [Patescibacteria group bacterium]